MEKCLSKCYILEMLRSPLSDISSESLSDLEKRYFWWEPVTSEPRSKARVVAQAMNLALFEDMKHLESHLGYDCLVEAMLAAEPGWFSDRSWEFWRGRLAFATGRAISEEPPRRSFDAGMF